MERILQNARWNVDIQMSNWQRDEASDLCIKLSFALCKFHAEYNSSAACLKGRVPTQHMALSWRLPQRKTNRRPHQWFLSYRFWPEISFSATNDSKEK